VRTARLELHPFSPRHWLALMEGELSFEQSFGLPAAEGLRESLMSGEVSPAWVEELRTARAADPWVHGFALVLREAGAVVGSVGFKGPPDADGVVEVAYGVVPAQRGRGIATEAAASAVAYAQKEEWAGGAVHPPPMQRTAGRPPLIGERVRLVRAHTLPERNASTRVLEKCGLARVIHEPRDRTPRFGSCRCFACAGPADDLEQVVEDAGARKVPAGAERPAKPAGRGVRSAWS